MEIEGCFRDTMEFHESPFRIGPEGFDAVDVSFAIGKLIVSMVHTIMLFVPQINQPIITAPGVRMNDTFKLYLAADNGLQRAVWRNRERFPCRPCHFFGEYQRLGFCYRRHGLVSL